MPYKVFFTRLFMNDINSKSSFTRNFSARGLLARCIPLCFVLGCIAGCGETEKSVLIVPCTSDEDCADQPFNMTTCSKEQSVCVVLTGPECTEDIDCSLRKDGKTKCNKTFQRCDIPQCTKDDDCKSREDNKKTCDLSLQECVYVPSECRNDSECMADSACDGADEARGIKGVCKTIASLSPCVDLDRDNFYVPARYAPEGTNCSFGNGIDHNDNDNTVFPGAPEYCDGKDNSGDGCVDGVCKVDGACSGTDKSKCELLYEICLGPISATREELEQTVMCDPRAVGMRVCLAIEKNGEDEVLKAPTENSSASFIYVLPQADGSYIRFDPFKAVGLDPADYAQFQKQDAQGNFVPITMCPKVVDFKRTINGVQVPYSEAEFVENTDEKTKTEFAKFCEFDRDCNGIPSEGCESCSEENFNGKMTTTHNMNCLVHNDGTVAGIDAFNEGICKDYTDFTDPDKDQDQTCGCYGKLSCTDAQGNKVWGTDGFCNITINGKTYSFPYDGQKHQSERESMIQANPELQELDCG